MSLDFFSVGYTCFIKCTRYQHIRQIMRWSKLATYTSAVTERDFKHVTNNWMNKDSVTMINNKVKFACYYLIGVDVFMHFNCVGYDIICESYAFVLHNLKELTLIKVKMIFCRNNHFLSFIDRYSCCMSVFLYLGQNQNRTQRIRHYIL